MKVEYHNDGFVQVELEGEREVLTADEAFHAAAALTARARMAVNDNRRAFGVAENAKGFQDGLVAGLARGSGKPADLLVGEGPPASTPTEGECEQPTLAEKEAAIWSYIRDLVREGVALGTGRGLAEASKNMDRLDKSFVAGNTDRILQLVREELERA